MAGELGGDGTITVSVAIWCGTGVLALFLATVGACLMYCISARIRFVTHRRLIAVVNGPNYDEAGAVLAGGLSAITGTTTDDREDESDDDAAMGGEEDGRNGAANVAHLRLEHAAAPVLPGSVHRSLP